MATIKHKLIKNFFSSDELKVYQKYCFNKLDQDKNYILSDEYFSPWWYNDPLMLALLDIKLPIVEKESNLQLYPTCAFWKYYIFGGTLAKHIDRPSCEVSITACVKLL